MYAWRLSYTLHTPAWNKKTLKSGWKKSVVMECLRKERENGWEGETVQVRRVKIEQESFYGEEGRRELWKLRKQGLARCMWEDGNGMTEKERQKNLQIDYEIRTDDGKCDYVGTHIYSLNWCTDTHAHQTEVRMGYQETCLLYITMSEQWEGLLILSHWACAELLATANNVRPRPSSSDYDYSKQVVNSFLADSSENDSQQNITSLTTS